LAAAAGLLTVGGVLTNPGPAAAAAPGSPATASAVAGRRAILVSWTPPSGGGVGHYHATAGGQECNSTGMSCTIGNLTGNTAYVVNVAACTSVTLTNNTECSAATPANSVTTGPPGTPAAPTVVFNGGPNTVTLSWALPDPGAGIDSYRITPTPSDGLTGTCGSLVSALTRTCDFGNLTSDTSYTFKVTAIGVNTLAGTTGTSAAGAASAAKVAGKPHAPAKPSVTRYSDNAVTVGWSKPGGGQAISGYTVKAATSSGAKLPADCPAGPDATECRVAGLDTGGTYTFTVTANGETPGGGSSEASAASDAIIPGMPAVPSTPTVELGAVAGAVTVSWEAPDEGGTVTSYVVTADSPDHGALPVPCTVGGSVTHCEFTGLDNGKSYRFKVTATNAAGSPSSAWSDPIVSQLPGEPAAPDVALGDMPGKVTLTWPAASTGGPVVYYGVTVNPATGNKTGTKTAGCGFNLSAPSCTITNLDPAVSYTFKVTAVGDLGSVDSSASVSAIPNKPAEPADPVVTLDGPTAATVTWDEPADGAGEVASYTVTATPSDGATPSVGCDEAPADTRTCSFTGLNAAKSYSFTVTASNPAGDATATATTATPHIPSEPQTVGVVLRQGTPGTVDVNWSAPEWGTATRYVVTAARTDGGTAPSACKVTGTTCAFTGLVTTKKYTFTVRAENLLGGTDAAATDPVVPDQPGAPTSVTVTVPAANAATVTWAEPADGGAVESYTVTAIDSEGAPTVGCEDFSADTTTCDFTGLPLGAYTFEVEAINKAGSTSTTTTDAITLDKPGAPQNVHAVLGDAPGKVTVTWEAPAGAAVTEYAVTPASDDGGTIPTTCDHLASTERSCTFTGLTKTAHYTFTVSAANDVDSSGAEPVPVAPIIPDEPGAPSSVAAIRGNAPGKVTVNWAIPGAGGEVATYTATATPSDGGTPTVGCDKVSASTKTCAFTGLTATKSYKFTVSAANKAGQKAASAPSLIPNKPDKPANVKVAVGVPGTVTVTWDPPTGADVTNGWIVTPSSFDGGATPSPATCVKSMSAGQSCTFTGLTTTASYTFVVQASNEAGPIDSDTTAPIVANAPSGPGAPAAQVIAADKVRLIWAAPASGGPVDKYTVMAYTSGAPETGITSTVCTNVAALTCDFDKLLETETYTFRVTATGPGGSGAPGARSAAITTAGPGKPDVPTVELSGPNAVKVTWATPAGIGPVTSYSVISTPDLSAPARCTNVRALNCVFDRLRGGTAYTFKVVANGTADRSTASEASKSIVAGPPGTPAAPTVALTDKTGQIEVTWTAPTTGGTITGYQVLSSPDGLGCASAPDASTTSCAVQGLNSKTSYTFRVKALGATGGGDSEYGPASASIVPGAPTAPTDVVAAGGDRQIEVSWTLPADTSRVDHYRAVTTPDSLACETTTSTDNECLITGAKNLTAYSVTVTAVGADGTNSSASVSSSRVRPSAGRPGSPTGVQATNADARTVVSWTAPGSIGDGIARYIATAVSGSQRLSCSTAALTCTITGLTNGNQYSVTVVSVGQGASGYSEATPAATPVTPKNAPGVPTGVTVTGGAKTLTVGWKAGSLGDGLAGFTVTATGGTTPLICTTTGTSTLTCPISNVTPGVYSVTVVARGTTAGITSAASSPVEGTALVATAPLLPGTLPSSGGTLTVSSGTVKPGGTVTVSGSGFAPYTGVSLGIYSSLVKLTPTPTTDAKGAFTQEVTIPSSGVTGAKTLVAGALPTSSSLTVKYLTGTITVSAG
jgi:hypothetical protein